MSETTHATTQDEAEQLAVSAAREFLDQCRLNDRSHMSDCLMKLCCVAGVLMAQATGAEDSAARLEGTAAFIRKRMSPKPARMEPIQ